MPTFRKKYKPQPRKSKTLTGEDILMLRDAREEGKTKASSPSYKDHIDGA